ncbi:MAG: cellulase family glycosylhydrolase [Halothiobacillaceae bacterium]
MKTLISPRLVSKSKTLLNAIALGVALSVGSLGTAHAYSVSAGKIYTEAGQRVQLNGVNWFGFETTSHAPHGLWARNADEMIAQMKSLGINAVRLPIAPATLRGEAVSTVDLGLNPNLAGKNGLQLLDYIIDKLDKAGMYILLDHHRPDDYAISELWYTDSYSEAQWIADLEFMAERYKNVPHVFGIDLKNEPHGRVTWGTGNFATDWNLAAERASSAVLRKNPHVVVFVAGVDEQATCSSPHGHGWGGNFEPLRCMPLAIPQDKLVLTPHFYGPDVYMHSYFSAADFPANMPAIWNTNFGFAKDMGYAVIPTEFGSRYGHDGGLALDKVWFDAAIDWMVAKDMRDGFYWSWNPNSSDTGGLLQNDWINVWTDKLAKLHHLWGLAGSIPTPAPAPAPTPTPAPAPAPAPTPTPTPTPPILVGDEFKVERQVNADWNAGYCVTYNVKNVSQHAGTWNTSFGFQDRLDNVWGATVRVEAASLKASGEGWNNTLNPGEQTSYGYCATRPQPESSKGSVGVDELPAQLSSLGDWGTGYCMAVKVTNTSGAVVPWATSFPVQGVITQSWSARVSQNGTQAQANGEDWNSYLQPGASAEFGFCANR